MVGNKEFRWTDHSLHGYDNYDYNLATKLSVPTSGSYFCESPTYKI